MRQRHRAAIVLGCDHGTHRLDGMGPDRDCARKAGRKPIINGTRLRPEDLLTNREQGIEWLVENHGGITPDTVRAVFDFYHSHKKARVPHPA